MSERQRASSGGGSGHLDVVAPDGVPEVREGDDLAELLLDALTAAGRSLRDGDVVAVTSKVVSKSEGQVRTGTRDDALAGETRRLVARRGGTAIVRSRLGLTMAAAGIDASNVEAGRIVLLPLDPDDSARRLRTRLRELTGANVAVLVTDTAGRAWREGQTDLAIGAAGLVVLEEYAGRTDSYGNPLAVTAPAVADELAGAAELAQGKLAARPFAVIAGRADLVLPAGEHGPGAGALVREEGRDFFGYGAREAVVRALAGRPEDAAPFGAPAPVEDLLAALRTVFGLDPARLTYEPAAPDGTGGPDHPDGPDGPVTVPLPADARLEALAYAHGWQVRPQGAAGSLLLPRSP